MVRNRKRNLNQRGMILIMVMWILTILSVFAVGLGYRSSIELRLTSLFLTKVRASYLGQQSVYTVFFHIANDPERKTDAYNESWGNNPDLFYEAEYEDAVVTVSHLADTNDEEKIELYGAEDEMGRININTIPKEILESDYWKEEFGVDDELVEVITHWREDTKEGKDLDSWYETTYGYEARHASIQLLEELHFLKNFHSTSSQKNKKRARLEDIITCFGDGQVNMNTATVEVLNALFVSQGSQTEFPRSDREELVRMVIEYRNGDDGLPGTEDDQIFEDVNIETAIGTHDAKKISMLNWLRNKKLIGVTSDYYRINATVSFPSKNLEKHITAIVTRSKERAKQRSASEEKKSRTITVVDEKLDKDIDPMQILKYFED